jgi:predicted lipid-binding transport protein (Tim44 family)
VEALVVGVVLLAMVAAFLGFRLYSVLGRRTGHEQPLVTPVEERKPAILAGPSDVTTASSRSGGNVFENDAAQGLRSISAADQRFDVGQFIDGAQSAYRMILEAYWKGDEVTLTKLSSEEVREAFAEAIAARTAAGHVLDNRLVSIERAVIAKATLEGSVAHVTVNFDADIAAVTRDKNGSVIAGSVSDAITTQDVWTFSRDIRVTDPDWILTDTDEAA